MIYLKDRSQSLSYDRTSMYEDKVGYIHNKQLFGALLVATKIELQAYSEASIMRHSCYYAHKMNN